MVNNVIVALVSIRNGPFTADQVWMLHMAR